MKGYLLLWICFWITVIILQGLTESDETCKDKTSQCTIDKCTQPGIAEHCKKTCGHCSREGGCPDGYYKGEAINKCITCSHMPSPRTHSYNISCEHHCPRDKWGKYCQSTCSVGCLGSECVRLTGACLKGCKLCYEGSSCVTSNPNCNCDDLANCSCKSGHYGIDCSSQCSVGCNYKACDNGGYCTHGCEKGWYGRKCDKKCPNCRSDVCAHDTGTCSDGCKIGFYGAKCNNNCSSACKHRTCGQEDGRCLHCRLGKFGDKCDKPCPVSCLNKTCSRNDGHCDQGCGKRHFGDKCDKLCPVNCNSDSCYRSNGSCFSCKSGYTGHHCNMSCPDNCAGSSCHQNGSCRGCNDSYRGSHCITSCPSNCTVCDQYGHKCSSCVPGRYGQTCNKTCNTCVDGACNIADGYCVHGCSFGFYDDFCRTPCSPNCQEHNGEIRCSRDSGSCRNGCKDGWFGDRCDKECNSGCEDKRCDRITGRCTEGCITTAYGGFCNNSCSDHCHLKQCHTTSNLTNPTCTKRCDNGFWGNYCDVPCLQNCLKCDRSNGTCLKCNNNRYGGNCSQSCSGKCFNSTCNMTGTCTLGCKIKFWALKCDKTCPQYCIECDRNNGACVHCEGSRYGTDCDQKDALILWVVVPSFLIILLVVLAFVVLRRNKSKKPYKMKRRIFSSAGSCVNMLSIVNPSYLATPKGNMTPNEEESSESQPLTESERQMTVQLRADVKMKEDPFYRPARMHPRVFSSYLPSDLIQEDTGTSSPYPCQLPDEPQLGCVWSTEVPVENFRDYVTATKKNLGLTNQFFDLPYGKLGPCDEGERPINAFKNRYRNILPYDHSRVKLEFISGIPGSDYINASYINGYGKPKAFVASQGPYGDVLWDFWRMVWEINSGKIVMLTNFVENRKNKCEQYWPDPGQRRINYDGVYVQCVTEKHLAEYTVRTFSVQMEEEPERTIKQYHFTAWPDRGVPQDVTSVVDFHQLVKQSPAARYGPIIVHCSAGVGRTGTFLALDYLIAQAKAEGVVDVYECVTRLRHQRMDVIQTEEQYIFLHDALVEALPSADRPSKEPTVNHRAQSKQELNGPSKRGPERVRNPFVDQRQTTNNKRYQARQLPDIPMETFSSLFSTTQDRRS